MRTTLLGLVAAMAVAGLVWFAAPDDDSGPAQELRAPVSKADGVSNRPIPAASHSPAPPQIPIDRIDSLPDGLAERMLEGGESWLTVSELDRQIIRFEFDPVRPPRMTGEHVLRAISEVRGVDSPVRFLKTEDLEKFRQHRFMIDLEPRMEVGVLVSHCPLIGFEAVEWEGYIYLVPHDGYREASDPLPEGADEAESGPDDER